MRILLLGATGFLGRHIYAHLLEQGHMVIAGVRNRASVQRRFPGAEVTRIDLNQMTTAEVWAPYLKNLDAVINCAGILQSGRGQSAVAIHTAAPIALFNACLSTGVERVIQISAVSADTAAGTEYALTKKAADVHLQSLDLDWVVLRPSLIYAQGSFGGTSAMRGLAGLPFAMPMPGAGDQVFQPLHANDLAKTVGLCLTRPDLARRTLDPVGPETLTFREILLRLRSWLDLPGVRTIQVPLLLVRLAAKIGDLIGRGPLRTTAIEQLLYGNISDPTAFERQIGFRPRSLAEVMRSEPSHVQDRWHAKVYWLRPFLSATLALMWVGSGLFSLTNISASRHLALAAGTSADLASFVTLVFALLDIGIGIGVIVGNLRWLGALQIVLVGGYTLALSVLLPGLWLDPLGPLLKNLPILAAISLWSALRDET